MGDERWVRDTLRLGYKDDRDPALFVLQVDAQWKWLNFDYFLILDESLEFRQHGFPGEW